MSLERSIGAAARSSKTASNNCAPDQSLTKVLYILGRGRSGSTIFANVMAEYDGFFSAGELRYFWDPVLARDAECACGARLSECMVWSKVISRLGTVSVEEAARFQRRVASEPNLLRLLGRRRGAGWPELDAFSNLMDRLYQAIRDVTGATVIVDSSKRPSFGAVVRRLPSCDFYCVHMVRDPRASAFSWGNSRHRSMSGRREDVPRRGALNSTMRWNILNLEAELLLRQLPKRGMRFRYEDFVDAPGDLASEVAAFVGEASATSPFVDRATILMRPNHMIAGNPSRRSVGQVTIQDTGRWSSAQRARDRRVATAVALPFLHRYGYPLRRRNGGDREALLAGEHH